MRQLGRYHLISRLSTGSLGDVYFGRREGDAPPKSAHGVRAEGVSLGGQELAIKLLRAERARDPHFARILFSEAVAGVRFEHPAAARLFEVDQDGPELFLVMEHVHGQPLSALLRRAATQGVRVEPDLVAFIGAEAAAALARAHVTPWSAVAPGSLFHAGVAPRSLMVTYDGAVKLLGLGFGRARATVAPSAARLPYLAPELLVGSRTPTNRTDAYALAVVLYDAFSDGHVFRRATEEETKAAIQEAQAPGLSPEKFGVTPAVSDVLAQLMSREVRDASLGLPELEHQLRAMLGPASATAPERLAKLMRTLFEEEIRADRRVAAAVVRAHAPISSPLAHAETADMPPSFVRSLRAGASAVEWSADLPAALHDEAPGRGGSREGLEGSTLDIALERRIGRYQAQTVVRRSANAMYFRARDPNIARTVLLKVLDPDHVSDPRLPREAWIRLFKAEAELAGRLDHPALPRLFDAGRDGASYYLAYADHEGEPLSIRLERGEHFAMDRVRAIALDLALGLEHLHRRGIFHGDVRAQNVVVDAAGAAHFVDLSMARMIEGPRHPLAPGHVLASAPEVLGHGACSTRSEQFALGALLYHLLTGARPFAGETEQAIVGAIQQGNLRPPESLDPRIDPELSRIVMRMLEPDPALRFENLQAVADRLAGRGSTPRAGAAGMSGKPALPQDALEVGPDGGPLPSVAPSSESLGAAALPPAALAASLLEFYERTTALGVRARPVDLLGAIRTIAARLQAGPAAELEASLAFAARSFAARHRLSPSADAMVGLLPEPLAPLLDEVEAVLTEPKAARAASVTAQVAASLEVLASALEGQDDTPPPAIERALTQVRDRLAGRVRPEVLDALNAAFGAQLG